MKTFRGLADTFLQPMSRRPLPTRPPAAHAQNRVRHPAASGGEERRHSFFKTRHPAPPTFPAALSAAGYLHAAYCSECGHLQQLPTHSGQVLKSGTLRCWSSTNCALLAAASCWVRNVVATCTLDWQTPLSPLCPFLPCLCNKTIDGGDC